MRVVHKELGHIQTPNQQHLYLGMETRLEVTLTRQEEDLTIKGEADYTFWYGNRSDICTNLVLCEAKRLGDAGTRGRDAIRDEKQLRQTVLSAYDQPNLNEFSAQLGLPMPTRLLRMGHPVHKLDEQFRYRPVFAEFPNRRTYDGELKSHPSTNEITVNRGCIEAMKALVPTGPAPAIVLWQNRTILMSVTWVYG
jgi:hypothetical protein